MKFSTILRLIRLWPPFLGAGIRVKEFNTDYSYILVQMKMRFWNQNYVGTHFGGSLYSMTDPFYMLMLMHALGRDYVIWDKSATIHYIKPAKGKIFARFELLPDQVELIKSHLEHHSKFEPIFHIKITDSEDNTVAEIRKTLYVRKKHR